MGKSCRSQVLLLRSFVGAESISVIGSKAEGRSYQAIKWLNHIPVIKISKRKCRLFSFLELLLSYKKTETASRQLSLPSL
ncbi:hypothetical protein C8J56DRAFT_385164 [Mycena floridula]|nr:hypothetical protein C8J56DRAFT_385164 [Mycena floridula]